MKNNFIKYIIFWFSQTVSQLGSSMTGFALILWIYMQKGSALEVSLMSFFNYVPFIIVSLLSGTFVDQYSKKKIIIISDIIAAIGTVIVLVLYMRISLQVVHIYLINFLAGIANAFQGPASAVLTYKMVSKEKLSQVSGLVSFSTNLNMILAPVLTSTLFAFGGLKVILLIDLVSFILAITVMVLIEDDADKRLDDSYRKSMIQECRQGFQFLKRNQLVWKIIVTMAMLNFFSRLTYENILSPMILARSENDSMVLGIVNAAMGIAGIIGGIIVASGRVLKKNLQMIYLSSMFSFLFGDLLMGIGNNVWIWIIAGIAASLPIPFINASQNVILYTKVPEYMLGRIFAVRNAIQYSTIPIGILLGGFLADYVFEPFMCSENIIADILHQCVGFGTGSGMAVMFLCTGIAGSLFSLVTYIKLKKYLL